MTIQTSTKTQHAVHDFSRHYWMPSMQHDWYGRAYLEEKFLFAICKLRDMVVVTRLMKPMVLLYHLGFDFASVHNDESTNDLSR